MSLGVTDIIEEGLDDDECRVDGVLGDVSIGWWLCPDIYPFTRAHPIGYRRQGIGYRA